MSRVIELPNKFGVGTDVYIKNCEYSNWSIYEYKTPSGYLVHQHYLLSNGVTNYICESYNDKCKEQLLDAIDNYNKNGKLGFKAMKNATHLYTIHPNGTVLV